MDTLTEKQKQRALEIEQRRIERQQLRAMHKELYEELLDILARHDPVRVIGSGNPKGREEYNPEVGTILPRLSTATNLDDVLHIVYEEFVRWFDRSAGPETRYPAIAVDIWDAWRKYSQYSSGSSNTTGAH